MRRNKTIAMLVALATGLALGATKPDITPGAGHAPEEPSDKTVAVAQNR